MKKKKKPRVDHPDFERMTGHGALYELMSDDIAVFTRPEWKTPTLAQVKEYQERSARVDALGGVMRCSLMDEVGHAPAFTLADCVRMRKAVARAFPHHRIVGSWNGDKVWTFSVAIKKRT